jgi:hypothetical protein
MYRANICHGTALGATFDRIGIGSGAFVLAVLLCSVVMAVVLTTPGQQAGTQKRDHQTHGRY